MWGGEERRRNAGCRVKDVASDTECAGGAPQGSWPCWAAGGASSAATVAGPAPA